MATSLLNYKPFNGYIHNWLVAGPLAVPASDFNPDIKEDFELSVIRQYFEEDAGVTELPVDLGPLGPVTKDNPLITWRYYGCRDDHFVDFTTFYPTCHYLRSWAYAQVNYPSSRELSMILTTNGPADVWLNGRHLHRQEHFQKQFPQSVVIPATFQPGINEILVRFENAGIRETPYVMALQINGISDHEADIILPTDIEATSLEKRQILERVVEKAYLDRYVYGYLSGDLYDKNEPITLHFSSDLDVSGEITHRLQSLKGDIFQEGTKKCSAGSSFELAKTFPLRNGPHHLALLPPAGEYYIKKIRFERLDLFHVVRTPYSQKLSYGIDQRKKEALEDASKRRNDSIYCEIAKLALGQAQNIDRMIVHQAIERVNQYQDGSVCDLLGILGIMLRFKKKRYSLDNLTPAMERSILNYRYWSDQPGHDVMDFISESRQILFHTCEILAGKTFPNQTFTVTGKEGNWHKEHGEALAIVWLRQRGLYGFQEWDSPTSLEAILAALSYLVDLSSSEAVNELAAVLMDKIFFTLGLNSLQGAFGSTRGRSDTASVLSARLEATAGISCLMWGMGNYNENILGTVSLALCRKYKLPEIIRKIATDSPSALWNREHHGGPPDGNSRTQTGPLTDLQGVNKVTYKTQIFMLSSSQDYGPGEKGYQEHIWQATLGPDALVFVNHPTCMSEDDAHRPNLWVGNGVLPRVAQWGDVLISIYKLPPDDWLGFTHAYFPAVTFDEYQLEGNWAFARKGKAYLALTAACGLEFITHGQTAFRELRSFGAQNIWLCHMGQELLDGSFEDFQQKISALNVTFDHLSLRFNNLRGDALSFGWEGPFIVNDQEQPLSGVKHYENPYCIADLPASQMDILFQEEGIRLKFS